jgi:predicted aminopeptidase
MGQLDMISRQEPIARLLASPETPEPLRRRLTLVLAIRKFAETQLDLAPDGNFLQYADLGRPYAVYCVFAAPELSLEPKTWCYPLIGCAAYRGYFSENDARSYAGCLQAQGYDVAVNGADAYSTLGWFSDPVLNTFVDRTPEELAGLIFHELAHKIFYVADDTTFNESFAVTVETEGVRRWLGAGNPGDYRRYQRSRDRQGQVLALYVDVRRRLEKLYAGRQPDRLKRREKATIFAELESELKALRNAWGETATARPGQPLNNATIVSVGAYNDLVPAFQRLLSACQGDLAVFYRVCQHLADMPRQERRRLLDAPTELLEPAG